VAYFGAGKWVVDVDEPSWRRCWSIISSVASISWVFRRSWRNSAIHDYWWRRSFYLEPIFRLVTIFKPLLVAALLVCFTIYCLHTEVLIGLATDIQNRRSICDFVSCFSHFERKTPPATLFTVYCCSDTHWRWVVTFRPAMIANF
jgi:hypothetical protein